MHEINFTTTKQFSLPWLRAFTGLAARFLRRGWLVLLLLPWCGTVFGQQWSVEKANTWYASQPYLIGCNFIPSTDVNQLEMWQADTFDPVIIDRELGLAQQNGYNTARVFLHDLAWKQDPAGFKNRISQFLDIAARHKIRPMLVFFDDCWNSEPKLGPQPAPTPGVHNSQWVQSPGGFTQDASLYPQLEKYVKDILTTFKDDNRILLWDLYNEPGSSLHGDATLPLLRNVFTWARQVNPSQPVTSATFNKDPAFKNITAIQEANSDIISIHQYGDPSDTQQWIKEAKAFGRPVLCTEYMARMLNNSIQTHLPLFFKENVGCYNWGLVAGKTQTYFPWGIYWNPERDGTNPPALWFHDVLRPDGTPFDTVETNLLKKYGSIAKVVVPTSAVTAQTWRYTTTTPLTDWSTTGFSDGGWTSAPGGFGSEGTPGSTIGTPWTGSDIWLRQTVSLSDLNADALSRLALYIFHDDAAEIYLNGVLAATLPGYSTRYELKTISPKALSALKPGGPNVIAIHCHQQTGGQYIDAGVVLLDAPVVTQTPYNGVIALPGIVEAENFDNGGEGVAYHDTDSHNDWDLYRTNEAVDIEGCTEGGYNLATSRTGEWLKYTVQVGATGSYQIDTRVASIYATGSFHLEFDGVDVTGPTAVPNTGGWQSWQTVSSTVKLTAGQHVMRFVIDAQEFNTNNFTFKQVETLPNTPYDGVIALPGIVEVENFDNGGEGVAYHDTDSHNDWDLYRTNEAVDIEGCTEGGYNLATSRTGEWLKYTVQVGATGSYQIDTRVASIYATGSFHLEFDGVDVTGPTAVPNTGGWQSWQTVSSTVKLTAGQHVMRFVIDAQEFNTNNFTFSQLGEVITTKNSNYLSNRAPLINTPFVALPMGAVQANGWLLTQLQLQKSGLTGAAEELYKDDLAVGGTAWLEGGGKSDWERGPYYVKGLVSLAYVLNDADLKLKAQKYIDWVINSQQTNGSFGPTSNSEWWPRMLVVYYLRDYYEATEGTQAQDARILPFLLKYFKFQNEQIDSRNVVEWEKARMGDNIEIVLWLYNKEENEPWLLDLATKLRGKAYDWTDIFTNNRFYGFGGDFHPHHNVDVTQALKMPAVTYQQSNDVADRDAFQLGIGHLMSERGRVDGMFSGEEYLSTKYATGATELCGVVERMLSNEVALRILGDATLGDQLERVAFNALPAHLTKDYKQHTYYQISNEVVSKSGLSFGQKQSYTTGFPYTQEYVAGIVPGPYSGFPCCRFNWHMGWPMLVKHMWMATSDNGLAATVYGPSTITAKVANGVTVSIEEVTNYPFDETIRLVIKTSQSVGFPLKLRIPGWCANPSIRVGGVQQSGATAGTFFTINRSWSDQDVVEISFPANVTTSTWSNNSVGVERGPLAYALEIKENRTVTNTYPGGFNEFEVTSASPWNYGLMLDRDAPENSVTVKKGAMPTQPFQDSPIWLTVKAKQLPGWTIGDNYLYAPEPPTSPTSSTEPDQLVKLVPYGTNTLRIANFPVIGEGSVYEAENASIHNCLPPSNGSVGSPASGGKYVSGIDAADSYLEFGQVSVQEAGTYQLTIGYANGMGIKGEHLLTVNGGAAQSVSYPTTSGWGQFSVVTRAVTLQAGQNVIRLSKGNSPAELDYISLAKVATPAARQAAVASSARQATLAGAAASFQLSPNPASDQVTLNWEGDDAQTVFISTSSGVLVQQQELKAGSSATVSTAALSAGLYIVTLKSAKQVLQQKLVIIK